MENKQNKCITLAVSNRKGGVAKTTSTAAIAGILSRQGYRVLMVDLDSQANLTSTFLDQKPERTIADTLNDGKTFPIVKISPTLDIIGCNSDIVAVEHAMDGPADRMLLMKALAKIKMKYDFILIDCPPSLGFITCNAFTAADYVLVPTQATKKCQEALTQIADACYMAATPTSINAIFFTMHDPRPRFTRKTEAEIRNKYGRIVFKTYVRKSVRVEEAASAMTDIAAFDPMSNPAKDYADLVDEIVKMIGNEKGD